MIKVTTILTTGVFALLATIPSTYSQKLSMAPADLTKVLKQIDTVTPKGLPQTPVVPRETTDAQDLRLKGRVKSVFEETATLSSPSKEQWRAVTGFWEFGPDQKLLRDANFDWQGVLYGVSVYGYLRGMRVTLDGPVPDGSRFAKIAGGGDTAQEKKGVPDERYDLAFNSMYKDGRLVEEQLFSNDGRKQNRILYTYKNNEVEYRKYLPNGEFNEHYVYVYDSEGNEIERRAYHGGPEGVTSEFSTYVTRYERFDKERNWIERSVYEVSVVSGKRFEELIRKEYRHLEYFKLG